MLQLARMTRQQEQMDRQRDEQRRELAQVQAQLQTAVKDIQLLEKTVATANRELQV